MKIDLRSDTVTLPTPGMLDAMMNAKVGDDVFGEDETILALEKKAAALFGKEAGLFCPSGTMTNQLAIKLHTQPGDELICEYRSHIYNYEAGGISFHSGVQAKLIHTPDGILKPGDILENIQPEQDWLTRTSLVSLENTANKAGGGYYTLDQTAAVSKVCGEKKLKLHLDGARIFNALIETGESAVSTGSLVDTLSVCLSKGLGAPAGSLLLGSTADMKKARKLRKLFGGGMRQAGFLAAAGIYALDHHIDRLKEDHLRAKKLGDGISGLDYVDEVIPVKTNIVIFSLAPKVSPEKFLARLAEENIKAAGFGKQTIRMVTHLDFTDDMLSRTLEVLKKISPGL